jgi:thiol-disulfide isomerase/thioredoxin
MMMRLEPRYSLSAGCTILGRSRRQIVAAMVIGSAVAWTASAPARSQSAPPDSHFQDFLPIGDYLLRVDGVDSHGATIYRSDRAAALLVLAPELGSPVLLMPRSGEVSTVSIMQLARNNDGSVDLLADAELRSQGTFRVDGERVVLPLEDHEVILLVKPPLLGPQDLESMKVYNPEYGRRAAAYVPSRAALAALRQPSEAVRVSVYFGSWCPACKQLVPRMMKVAEELAGSKIQVDFYGLPKPLTGDPESERVSIRSVPTGIVYLGAREAGRISGDHWQNPEVALSDIFARSGLLSRVR